MVRSGNDRRRPDCQDFITSGWRRCREHRRQLSTMRAYHEDHQPHRHYPPTLQSPQAQQALLESRLPPRRNANRYNVRSILPRKSLDQPSQPGYCDPSPSRPSIEENSLMYFDRFDIVRAWYWFATNYHDGKSSPVYALFSVFSRLRFRPSPLDYGPERDNPEDDNCRVILADLIRRWRAGTITRFQ